MSNWLLTIYESVQRINGCLWYAHNHRPDESWPCNSTVPCTRGSIDVLLPQCKFSYATKDPTPTLVGIVSLFMITIFPVGDYEFRTFDSAHSMTDPATLM